FYANPALPAQKPHHNTTQAQNRSCEFCHGSFIDNWADGHYVPTYAMSLVTPDTKYKVVNATTGKKWGGCEGCHEPSAIVPGVPLVIVRNQDTHHNEVVGVTGGPTGPSCLWCHNTTAGAVNIRSCEQCHGVKSLHNIQYDYANTTGTLGHGHIGANWDCNGCHAWYVAGQDGPVGPLVPDISSVSTNDFISGQTTVLTINGNNFVNTVNGVTYTSTVKIVSETGAVTTLTPTTISASQIKVTVPSLSVGTYALYVSKDGGASGELKSKEVPITVSSKVTISSAKLSSGTITITGTGFGLKPTTNAQQYVTIVHAGKTYYSDSITSWSNTQIKAKSSVARSGDTVTVTRADGSGQASKVITR
ncbi:MAG TPA: IPT/TIG domain-containing protein, partial [Candidatus Methanoperedens sp.]